MLYASVAVLAGAAITALACADYDWESSFVSLFHKNLSEAPNTEAFYLSDRTLFSEENFDKEDVANVKEWAKYCNGRAKEDDIRWVLANGSSPMLNAVNAALAGSKRLPDSLKNNTFLQHIVTKHDSELLQYLSFAVECQGYVNVSFYDMWDYKAPDQQEIRKLLDKGEEGYNQCSKDFLKLRWGFQVARLAHYNNLFDDFLRYYNNYINPIKLSSEVQTWSLSLYAGMLYKTGKMAESAYLFSRVFETCPKYRLQAYNSFRHIEPNEVEAAVALCKDNHEKAVIKAMQGYNSFENVPQLLRTIAQLDPTLPDLEVLAIREINKIELSIGSPSSYYTTSEKSSNKAYLDSISRILQPILLEVAKNKQTPTPSLWYVGSSYLYFLCQEYDKAKQMVTMAEKSHPTSKVKDQISIVRLLVEINQNKELAKDSDETIAKSLEWLRSKALADTSKRYYYGSTDYFYRSYQSVASELLAKKYLSQNNAPMAILCQNLSNVTQDAHSYSYYSIGGYIDSNASIGDIEKLIELQSKANKTKLEVFLTKHASIGNNHLYELIGTKYLRTYQFEKAEEYYKKLPATYWGSMAVAEYLNEDPFADNDNTSKPTKKHVRYNKLTFARKMIEYSKLATQGGEKGATYYYLLANAYFNISHAGNSWAMSQYEWSGSEYYQPYNGETNDPFKNDYYKATTAMNLYFKAASLAKNPEMKARCLFQASKCYALQVDAWHWDSNYTKLQAGDYIKKNKYFKELVQKYRNTKYYKYAYARCSYLRDYVNNN